MSRRNAEILLAAVIIARSTACLLSKITMEDMGPFTLMAWRFLIAFAVLAVLFHRHIRTAVLAAPRRTLASGLYLGGLFFLVMSAELFGLRSTDSSTTSFLENTAIVMVPLFQAALCRRLPGFRSLAGAALTLTGIGFLTLQGARVSLGQGEVLCLLAAALYALAIILTDRLSRSCDPLVLGILQVGVMGSLSLFAALLFETPAAPSNGSVWAAILYLSLICSCFGFTLQPVAQRHTSAQRASLFCALNPLTAAVLGVLLLHEQMGPSAILGAAFVLSGILLASLAEKKASQKPGGIPGNCET